MEQIHGPIYLIPKTSHEENGSFPIFCHEKKKKNGRCSLQLQNDHCISLAKVNHTV